MVHLAYSAVQLQRRRVSLRMRIACCVRATTLGRFDVPRHAYSCAQKSQISAGPFPNGMHVYACLACMQGLCPPAWNQRCLPATASSKSWRCNSCNNSDWRCNSC